MTKLLTLGVNINDKFFANSPDAQTIAGGGNANIGELITSLLPNAIIGAGVIFLFLLIGAGFSMISSSGKDDAKAAAQAKNTITFSVIGFLLVISAFFILQAIKVIIGIDFLNNPTSIP